MIPGMSGNARATWSRLYLERTRVCVPSHCRQLCPHFQVRARVSLHPWLADVEYDLLVAASPVTSR